jgi:hypothetical protein
MAFGKAPDDVSTETSNSYKSVFVYLRKFNDNDYAGGS